MRTKFILLRKIQIREIPISARVLIRKILTSVRIYRVTTTIYLVFMAVQKYLGIKLIKQTTQRPLHLRKYSSFHQSHQRKIYLVKSLINICNPMTLELYLVQILRILYNIYLTMYHVEIQSALKNYFRHSSFVILTKCS